MDNTILLATLNHNLSELTDNLCNQLKKDPMFDTHCELMCLDNGSITSPISTTHYLDENVYFGGGFNVVLEYFLNQTNHKWLYFLNNDLLFHDRFVSTSIQEANKCDADVYSPSVINASIEQCNWKQMLNWGSGKCREVEWIDFQAPLIHRSVLENIKQFPHELIYGWGLDVYTGIVCKEHGFRTVVSDTNTICHLNSQTLKQNKVNIGMNEFCRRAETAQNNYFKNNAEFHGMRSNAANYTFK